MSQRSALLRRTRSTGSRSHFPPFISRSGARRSLAVIDVLLPASARHSRSTMSSLVSSTKQVGKHPGQWEHGHGHALGPLGPKKGPQPIFAISVVVSFSLPIFWDRSAFWRAKRRWSLAVPVQFRGRGRGLVHWGGDRRAAVFAKISVEQFIAFALH